MAANRIYIQVDFQSQSANQAITTLNKNIASIGSAAKSATATATGAISGLTSTFLKGVVGGNLLTNAIQTALAALKDFGVQAAIQGAQIERMEVATLELAKANGIAAEEIQKRSEAVQQLGIEDDKALEVINKMIVANVDLEKAQPLAQMAKDLAALKANMDVGEAFEEIVQAIEFGNARALRSLGIRVEFDKRIEIAERTLGRALSENEKQVIRLNEFMAKAGKVTGSSAAVAKTAEGQWMLLAQQFRQLRQDIGRDFADELRKIVEALREAVKWVSENREQLKEWLKILAYAAAGGLTYKIAQGILGVATAVKELNAALLAGKIAMASNPMALLITGGLAAGAIVYTQLQDIQKGIENRAQELERSQVLKDLQSGKLNLQSLRKRGLTDEQIRERYFGGRAPETAFRGEGGPLTGKPVAEENLDAQIEALKKAAEIRKKSAEADRQAHEFYMRAIDERKQAEQELMRKEIDDSVARIQLVLTEAQAEKEANRARRVAQDAYTAERNRIMEEERREIQQRSTYIDEKGAVQRFQLSRQAMLDIQHGTLEKIKALNLKYGREEEDREKAILEAQIERARTLFEVEQSLAQRRSQLRERLIFDPLKAGLYEVEATRQNQERIEDAASDARIRAVERRAALEVAGLEEIQTYTIEQKIAVEQRKTEIEIQGIREREALERDAIDRTTRRQIAAAQAAAIAAGNFNEEFHKQLAQQISDLGEIQKREISEGAVNAIQLAQSRVRGVVAQENRRVFENLKDQAGKVFDALLDKSTTIWQAIANSFKTAMLTAIREVVSSQVARSLMSLFGAKGGGTAGGGGFNLGGLLGNLGGFGGFGPGAPGGTPGFTGAVGQGPIRSSAPAVPQYSPMGGYTPAGPQYSQMGGATQLAGFGAQWASLKSSLSWLGNLGSKTSGVHGAAGGAMLLGGATLAYAGLRRGGWSGLAMTTAGGALIGAKFGGPLGAAIGAAAGFAAGLIRMTIKGADEKVREKVKQVYGVDITEKNIRQQIVEIAKQRYGGNLDLAIRSPEVQELVNLYAISTGKGVSGMPRPMYAATFGQSGAGGLQLQPVYSNGQMVANPYTGVTTQQWATQGLYVQLDPRQANDLFEGRVVNVIQGNSVAVGASTARAAQSGESRQSLRGALVEPLTVMR